jgi:predicted Rossmann fold nucleotide-binding protein DprA/Smf involved in DNA uptake
MKPDIKQNKPTQPPQLTRFSHSQLFAAAPANGLRLAVVGSRGFADAELLARELRRYDAIAEIISGGARGVDALAAAYARANNIPLRVFEADWVTHGNSAGIRRNREIVAYADEILAIWDGQSPGTRFTIRHAIESGKPVTAIILPKR